MAPSRRQKVRLVAVSSRKAVTSGAEAVDTLCQAADTPSCNATGRTSGVEAGWKVLAY